MPGGKLLVPPQRPTLPYHRDAVCNPSGPLKMDHYQDAEHLRLLSIFHYIVAGIVGLISLFPLIHLAVGIAILSGAFDEVDQGGPPPAVMGWLFVFIPLVFIVMGLSLAICIAVAGRKLSRRTGYHYCLVIAGLECIFMPFGTVLGVLTIVVLNRSSVRVMFGLPTGRPPTNDGEPVGEVQGES